MNAWLLVPCAGSRVEELVVLAKTLDLPPNRVVVVTTPPDPVDKTSLADVADTLIVMPTPDMLFGVWLNAGLDFIATQVRDGQPYEVACFSSDLRVDADALTAIVTALRDHNLAMAGPDLCRTIPAGETRISDGNTPRTLWNRVPGPAMLVAGELGLRFDPRFRWYYADDDFETQHRHHGGVGLVGGVNATHQDTAPGPLQQSQAVEDRAKYVAKWGRQPW